MNECAYHYQELRQALFAFLDVALHRLLWMEVAPVLA